MGFILHTVYTRSRRGDVRYFPIRETVDSPLFVGDVDASTDYEYTDWEQVEGLLRRLTSMWEKAR